MKLSEDISGKNYRREVVRGRNKEILEDGS
jgi:hypothetical protein